jgi:hypothetical protein
MTGRRRWARFARSEPERMGDALNRLVNGLLQDAPPGEGWFVQGWLVTVVFQRGQDATTRVAKLGTCQATSSDAQDIAEAALPLVQQRARR